MFALLVASTVLLPSVLGNCCMPDVFESVSYIDNEPNRAIRLIVSFNKMKWYTEDIDKNHGDVAYELFDASNDKHYTMLRSGVCSYRKMDYTEYDTFFPCTHNNTAVGATFTMGNGVKVESYDFKTAHTDEYLFVTADNCLPMLMVVTDDSGDVTTHVYGNVTYTNVDDSVLDQDVSGCVHEGDEEI